MTRSQLQPLPAYFDRYILRTDDVDLITALGAGLDELQRAPWQDWQRIGDRVYAPGKWTVKDIVQHLIDTERIFSYRATAFARGDAEVRWYDEDAYANAGQGRLRGLLDMVDELVAVRQSTIHQFRSFTPDMLARTGNGFKGPYSVRDIGFLIPGHQRWHFAVIAERYVPLIGARE